MSPKNYFIEAYLQFTSETLEELPVLIERGQRECCLLGVKEYELDEESIDSILGEEAYCTADLSEESFEKIEKYLLSNQHLYTFYFNKGEEGAFLQLIQKEYPYISYSLQEKEVSDWNTLWRSHFSPIPINESFTIIPSWQKEDETIDSYKGEKLYLYPGEGFGTGQHETTFLCLKTFLEQEISFSDEDKVLDFGCGSGILGIAALKKMNSKKVFFCDVSESALENTKSNLAYNEEDSVEEKNIFLREDFPDELKNFKFIFANILLSALLSEAEFLVSKLAREGVILFSGILMHQREELIHCYTKLGLTFVEDDEMGQWAVVVMKKKEL